MRVFAALFVLLAFSGCATHSISPPTRSSDAYAHQLASSNYKLLYSFKGNPDGSLPWSGLVTANGLLYGTTSSDGAYNAGTVYSISPSGTERVLHSFGSGGDGQGPASNLLYANGLLYGTTTLAGPGLIFSVDPTNGTENVVYRFRGPAYGGYGTTSPDGSHPWGSLIMVGGKLYGTALMGGTNGRGTIFEATTAGTERVLYDFGGTPTDGTRPQAGLLQIGTKLFGTTGGIPTIFQTTTSGVEKVLHHFVGVHYYTNGQPIAGLISVGGTLWGTSVNGGGSTCESGCGFVFASTQKGVARQVYHFRGCCKDGAYPMSSLVELNGTLYGTTLNGGANDDGTVYSLSASGVEHVLHSFAGPDGSYPYGSLLVVGGKLYGTTQQGGKFGLGTVFEVTP